MNKFLRNRNIIWKYLEIFFTKVSIALKENKEYKINLWMGFFVTFALAFSHLLFYFVLGEFVNELIFWTFYDFSVFFSILLTTSLAYRFFVLFEFKNILVSGKLSNFLTKPINPYSLASMNQLSGSLVVFVIFQSLVTLTLIFLNTVYSNYLLAFIIVLLGFLIDILIINVIASLGFFIKESDFLFFMYRGNLVKIVENYTPKLFENTFFSNFIYLLPVSFMGYFLVEILNSRFQSFFIFLPYFLLIGIIFLCILILLWHYGLKKYEAFG